MGFTEPSQKPESTPPHPGNGGGPDPGLEAQQNGGEAQAEDLRTPGAAGLPLTFELAERQRRERELHKLNRTLRALSRSSQAMMHAVDEQSYLTEVCRIIEHDCGYALMWIGYARTDEAKSIEPCAFAGFDEGYLAQLQLTWADTERGRGPTGTAVRTGKPVICQNMQTDPNFAPWRGEALRRGYAASISLPLISHGTAFGALTLYSREPDPFSGEEVALLAELANDLAYGVTTLRLREAHRRMEESLERSEERLRLILEHTRTPMLILDDALRISTVSSEAARGLGRPREELLGRDVRDLLPVAAERAMFEQSLERLKRAGNREILILHCLRGTGEKQMFEWEILPIKTDQALKGVLVNLRDIRSFMSREPAAPSE